MSLQPSDLSETNIFQMAPFSADGAAAPNHQIGPNVAPQAGQASPWERRNRELHALYNLSLTLGSTDNVDNMMQTIYQTSHDLLEASNWAVALYDRTARTLDFRWVIVDRQPVASFQVNPTAEEGLAYHVLSTQAPLLLTDTEDVGVSIETGHLRPEQPIRAWLGVPISHPARPEAEPLGVITVWRYDAQALTDHDLWLLSALANQVAVALRQQTGLPPAEQRPTVPSQPALLEVVTELARLLISPVPSDAVLNRMMVEIERLLDIERGWLLLTDAATGDLTLRCDLKTAKHGGTHEALRIPRGQGVAGRVAHSGRPVMLTEVDAHTRNVLGVPVTLHDQTVGVLVVMNKRQGHFVQEDVQTLKRLATYAAIALENDQLQNNVFAEQDRLMDLEEQVRQEVARDLHDGPVQKVSAMVMRTDFCQKALSRDPALLEAEIATLKELGQAAIHEMRTLLVELRPLELEQHGQGLIAALRVFLERRQREVRGTRLSLTCSPNKHLSRQDPQVEKTIFTIVQETVNNALKHAQAREIRVEITENPDTIGAVISDDGRGFDVEQVMTTYSHRASLGMLNIRERAEAAGGTIDIQSKPGQGTHITLAIPKTRADRLRKRSTTGRLRLPSKMGRGDEA